MTFYEVFLDQMEKEVAEGWNIYITEPQKESIKTAAFFDKIPKEDFVDIAQELMFRLTTYNSAISGSGEAHNYPTSKEEKRQIKEYVATTEKFIKILGNASLIIPLPTPINEHSDFRGDLSMDAQKILSGLQNRTMMMFKKDMPTSKQFHITNFIHKICIEYNIPSGSRDVKKFIDKLDEQDDYEY